MAESVGLQSDQIDKQLLEVAKLGQYLPHQVAEGYSATKEIRKAALLKELADDPKPPSGETLKRTLDRLRAFEDLYCTGGDGIDLDFSVSLSLSLWNLLARRSECYGYSLRCHIVRNLIFWLNYTDGMHQSPEWLEKPATDGAVEALKRLSGELNAQVPVRMIIEEMSQSASDVGIPGDQRPSFVNELAHLCQEMRNFIDDASAEQIVAELSKHLNGRYCHVMLFARLIVVLSPKSYATELLKSGRLWKFWSAMPEGLVPKFDLMWFAMLGRYAKQKWMGTCDEAAEASLQAKLPWVLNKASRTLNLPTCSPSAGGLDGAKELGAVPKLDRYNIPSQIDNHVMGRKTNWAKVAKFVVYTLEAEPPNPAGSGSSNVELSSAWGWLAVLMQQLDPFLQPSSAYGEWVQHGFLLLQNLVQHYYKRSGRERLLTTKVPASNRLTRSADKQFADFILPVIHNCMQTSMPMVIAMSLEIATQLFQIVAPTSPAISNELASPPTHVDMLSILNRALDFLNDAEQAGKHTGMFQIFARSLQPILLRWPNLVNDVLPLLLLGINVTDLPKTLSTLSLLTALFTHIPAVDINDWQSSDSGSPQRYQPRWPVAGVPDPTFDSETSATIVSSFLPDFAMDYFERVREFISQMSEPTKKGQGMLDNIEHLVIRLMHSATHLISAQCSKPTYLRLLEALRAFLLNDLLVDQVKGVVAITSAIARVDPGTAVSTLLPPLLKKLKLPAEKPPKAAVLSELSKSEAKWFLPLVIAIVRHSGEALLPFRAELEAVIIGAFMDERDDVVKLGAKLMRRTLFSITATYIRNDFRTCASDTWDRVMNNKQASNLEWPLKWWGWTSPWWLHETPSIRWHEPTEGEVSWARDIIQGVLLQASRILSTGTPPTQVADSQGAHWLDSFEAHKKSKPAQKLKLGLSMIRACLRGSCGLWMDERSCDELRSKHLLSFSRYEADTGKAIFDGFASILLGTMQTFSGVECNSAVAAATNLPMGVEPIEIAGIFEKVFECVELLMITSYSSSASANFIDDEVGRHEGGMIGLLLYTGNRTPMENLHEESKWRALPRVWWTLSVAGALDNCHRDRCEHTFDGWRKSALEALCLLAMRASTKSTRAGARKVLLTVMPCHIGAEKVLLEEAVLPALHNETSAALKCGSVPPESADREELRLNGALDGVAHLLESEAFLRALWRRGVDHASEVGLVLAEAVYAVTKAQTSAQQKRCEVKPDTMAYVIRATQRWMQCCDLQSWADVEPYDHTFSAARATKVAEVITQLLEICIREDCHWRAQVMTTIIVLTLQVSMGCQGGASLDKQKMNNVWLQWTKLLMTYCNPKMVPPLQSLGVYGLSLLLLQQKAGSVSIDLTQHDLFSNEFQNKLLDILPKLHHSALINAGESGHDTDPTDPAVKVIMAFGPLSLWPHVWGSKSPGSLAIQNILFWQRYLSAGAEKMGADRLSAFVGRAAEFLAQKPIAEPEYHTALCEFFAGTFRALREESLREFSARAWASVHQWLRLGLQNASQERLGDWCNAFRFLATGTSQPHLQKFLHSNYKKTEETKVLDSNDGNFLIPVFNFVLDPESSPNTDTLKSNFVLIHAAGAASPSSGQAIDQEGSSFAVYKRLRLLVALLVEPSALTVIESDTAFCTDLFKSLWTGIGHPYKQLREEAARLIVFLLRATIDSRGVSQQIQEQIAQDAERLLPQLREDNASQSRDESSRQQHVLESSGLCYVLLHASLERLVASLLTDVIPRCLGFLLAATTHGDFELRALATSVLATCGAAHLANPIIQGDKAWHDLKLAHELIRLLRDPNAAVSLTYKEREKAILLAARPILLSNTFALRSQSATGGDNSQPIISQSLQQMFEDSLGHSKPEVRNAAKISLTSSIVVYTPAQMVAHIKKCQKMAPKPKKGMKTEECTPEILAGVVGLSCALCAASDLGAPAWVGQVIEGIAPFGRSGAPDVLKKEVHGTIQMFLKSQQSQQHMWRELQEKLTPLQLDLLSAYKGTLSYYS